MPHGYRCWVIKEATSPGSLLDVSLGSLPPVDTEKSRGGLLLPSPAQIVDS